MRYFWHLHTDDVLCREDVAEAGCQRVTMGAKKRPMLVLWPADSERRDGTRFYMLLKMTRQIPRNTDMTVTVEPGSYVDCGEHRRYHQWLLADDRPDAAPRLCDRVLGEVFRKVPQFFAEGTRFPYAAPD